MEQTPVSEVEKMKKTYYEQLRGRNISSAELEQLKKKRIRQVAQIREGGDPAQYETARRYMAQVEAIEQLLREKETRQRAQDAWRALTQTEEPPAQSAQQMPEEDDFDAFLESLSDHGDAAQAKAKQNKEMTAAQADAYFSDAGGRAHEVSEEYTDPFSVPGQNEEQADTPAEKKDRKRAAGAERKNGKAASGGERDSAARRRSVTVRVFTWVPIALLGALVLILLWQLVLAPLPKYVQANKMFRAENYTEARKLYRQVPGIWGVEDNITQCEILAAQQLIDQGYYEDARAALQALAAEGVQVSEQLRECEYLLAEKLADRGKYEEAIEMLRVLGDWKDSETLLKNCYYQQGVAQLRAGNFASARDALDAYAALDGSRAEVKLLLAYLDAAQNAALGDFTALRALDGTAYEALSDIAPVTALQEQLDGFAQTYEKYLGAFEAAYHGDYTMKVDYVLAGDQITLRCANEQMTPEGMLTASNCEVGEDGALSLEITDESGQTWEGTFAFSGRELSVRFHCGDEKHTYYLYAA